MELPISSTTKSSGKVKRRSGFGETIRTVIYAVLIAMIVRTVAFEPFNIPTGSMIPTLMVGDYLFVSKYTYGYSRHSLPWSAPLIPDRIFASDPERGDIAVFKLPADTSRDYIKRIIGLPGDTIQVTGGILHINGEPVERELVGPTTYIDRLGHPVDVLEYVETLPNGVEHVIYEVNDNSGYDNTRAFVVPEGHFFAMGDNRDKSKDSRDSGVGFVPMENLVGRAEIIFFSTDGTASLWEFWKWPSATRWGRIFNSID